MDAPRNPRGEARGQPVPEWQPAGLAIQRTFRTGSFVRGVEFVDAIKDLAEAANHHPDILLTYPQVVVTLITHDAGRVTDKDRALALQINELWGRRFAA